MSAQKVVFVEDGTYRVDEEALGRVTSHEATRDLPVAVVSVAGATRGGKSFLLDFFLRYLRATDEARRDGSWIGADDQPLTGFSWRGGCDRDTDGIVVWSEPIILPLGTEDSDEKVAVVLMDTQGTFDCTTTIRDSSIIFAISSLLSSVQIYNLSRNIQEDDLQFLHLFTEFGRLAYEESMESPFQVLQFLVRDWSYAYQHPLGAEGGQQLIDKILQVRSDQAEELRELREHVHSVYEEVRCFLLPYPGNAVAADPSFRGCLTDIATEFKNTLLELVPSVFSPENIRVKKILGHKITVKDLAQTLRSYIEVFNGDTLPTPLTVMRALSLASVETAALAARAAYAGEMEAEAAGALFRGRGGVRRRHGEALQAARRAFAARRALAAPALAAARLDALLRDLDGMLTHYVAINNNKITAAIGESRAEYGRRMEAGTQKCLLPIELEELHAAAKEAAFVSYDAGLLRDSEDEDDDDEEDADDRSILEREMGETFLSWRASNEAAAQQARAAAAAALAAAGAAGAAAARCRHPAALHRELTAAAALLLADFRAAWRTPPPDDNPHVRLLTSEFEVIFEEVSRTNETNNNSAAAEAKQRYTDWMDALFEDDKCLHPQDLRVELEMARDISRDHFQLQRHPSDRNLPSDNFEQSLETEMSRECSRFIDSNKRRNNRAVQACFEQYSLAIEPPGFNALNMVSMDWSMLVRHTPAKTAALRKFQDECRLERPPHEEDEYLRTLEKMIEDRYEIILMKLMATVVMQVVLFRTFPKL